MSRRSMLDVRYVNPSVSKIKNTILMYALYTYRCLCQNDPLRLHSIPTPSVQGPGSFTHAGSSCSKATIGRTITPLSEFSEHKQAFRACTVSVLEAGLSWCIGGSRAIAEKPFNLRRWQHDGARQRTIGCSDWTFGYS